MSFSPSRSTREAEAPSELASALGSHGGSPSRNVSEVPARSIITGHLASWASLSAGTVDKSFQAAWSAVFDANSVLLRALTRIARSFRAMKSRGIFSVATASQDHRRGPFDQRLEGGKEPRPDGTVQDAVVC